MKVNGSSALPPGACEGSPWAPPRSAARRSEDTDRGVSLTRPCARNSTCVFTRGGSEIPNT